MSFGAELERRVSSSEILKVCRAGELRGHVLI